MNNLHQTWSPSFTKQINKTQTIVCILDNHTLYVRSKRSLEIHMMDHQILVAQPEYVSEFVVHCAYKHSYMISIIFRIKLRSHKDIHTMLEESQHVCTYVINR